MTWNMDRWLGIDKGGALFDKDIPMKIQGIGGQIEAIETPHFAMSREFEEETGSFIAINRWHCVCIKEYKESKVYFFAAFCSPIEMEQVVAIARRIDNGEGKIAAYDMIDIFFDPKQFTHDVASYLQFIYREMIHGFFHKLDPEGVNSAAKN